MCVLLAGGMVRVTTARSRIRAAGKRACFTEQDDRFFPIAAFDGGFVQLADAENVDLVRGDVQ